MKMEKSNNSMKWLPGITTRKVQLRNNSWAKLLRQQKTRNYGEGSEKITGLEVWCEPVVLNSKQTRKTGQEPIGKLANCLRRCENEDLEKTFTEKIPLKRTKTYRRSLDENAEEYQRSTSDGSWSKEDSKETSSSAGDRGTLISEHLPPLGYFNPESKASKETFNFLKISKEQADSFPRKKSCSIDWQKIFVNGGFRPNDSRDLPTRGEINLLKYKTWNIDDPLYCVTKCAKYFGLDSDEVKGENLTFVDTKPPKLYASLFPTYNFYPFGDPKRPKSFLPMQNISNTLMYLTKPSKPYNLCNTCVVPPVTPVPSMVRSSPFGWTPLPNCMSNMDRNKTLEELAEFSVDRQTKDEGIHSPNESELEF